MCLDIKDAYLFEYVCVMDMCMLYNCYWGLWFVFIITCIVNENPDSGEFFFFYSSNVRICRYVKALIGFVKLWQDLSFA